MSKKSAEKRRLGRWSNANFPGNPRAAAIPEMGNREGKKITKGKKKASQSTQQPVKGHRQGRKQKQKWGPRVGVREKSWRDVYSLHNLLVPRKLW